MTPYLLSSCVFFLLFFCTPAEAQRVELSPFGGYRFGWSVSQIGGFPVTEDDGGASFGVVADIPFGAPQDGYKFELLFSHESATVGIRQSLLDPPVRAQVYVDQFMLGVMQELEDEPGRPFVSALMGLTRYASPGEEDYRFALGLAGGGRFFVTPHLGLRIDGRVFMTIISLEGSGVCAGACAVMFNTNPVFQGELTAGVVFAF